MYGSFTPVFLNLLQFYFVPVMELDSINNNYCTFIACVEASAADGQIYSAESHLGNKQLQHCSGGNGGKTAGIPTTS